MYSTLILVIEILHLLFQVMATEEDANEDGYDSFRDEVSSVSSYNHSRGNLDRAFGSSVSLTTHAPKPRNKDTSFLSGERLSFSSYTAVPQLSEANVVHNPCGGKTYFHSWLVHILSQAFGTRICCSPIGSSCNWTGFHKQMWYHQTERSTFCQLDPLQTSRVLSLVILSVMMMQCLLHQESWILHHVNFCPFLPLFLHDFAVTDHPCGIYDDCDLFSFHFVKLRFLVYPL